MFKPLSIKKLKTLFIKKLMKIDISSVKKTVNFEKQLS